MVQALHKLTSCFDIIGITVFEFEYLKLSKKIMFLLETISKCNKRSDAELE